MFRPGHIGPSFSPRSSTLKMTPTQSMLPARLPSRSSVTRKIEPITFKRDFFMSKAPVIPELKELAEKHLAFPKDLQERKSIQRQASKTYSGLSLTIMEQFSALYPSIKDEEAIAPSTAKEAKDKHTEAYKHFLSGKTKEDHKSFRIAKASIYSEAAPAKILEFTHERFGGQWPIATKEASKEYGHVFDSKVENLEHLQEQNKKAVARKQAFLEKIESITGNNKPTTQVIQDLEKFIYQNGGIERFNSEELNYLVVQLWNHNGWNEIVEMMLQSKNPMFIRDPVSLELFALSSLKSDLYFNPHIALAAADVMLKQNPSNPQAHAILGIAHEVRKDYAEDFFKAALEGKLDEELHEKFKLCFPSVTDLSINNILNCAKETQALSLHYYNEAFSATMDPRYGLRIMRMQLDEKDMAGAQLTAQTIQMACFRDDVLYTSNLAVVRAFLETLYVTGHYQDLVPQIEARVLELCKTTKSTANTLAGLHVINHFTPSKASLSMAKRLEEHLKDLKSAKTKEDREKIWAARKAEVDMVQLPQSKETIGWNSKTYNYAGETSNYIEGTLTRAGGIISTQQINRNDRKFFEDLLQIPIKDLLPKDKIPKGVDPDKCLLDYDIDHVQEMLEVFDRFLRVQYLSDERELEKLGSEGHKLFEESLNAAIEMAGIEKNKRKEIKDDRTNLSMHLYSRLGDCRQHAQSKQIMFDIWKTMKTNEALQAAQKAVEAGDRESFIAIYSELDKLNSQQLKIWEMSVGYAPVDDPEGKFKRIESHTTNVLLTYDESGNISDVHICDSFYQTTYPFQFQKVPFKGKNPAKDSFVVGTIDVEGEKQALVVKSASYAGPKSQYNKASTMNKFAGIQERRVSAKEVISDRQKVLNRQSDLRSWVSSKHE